jgi:hypothetical protein
MHGNILYDNNEKYDTDHPYIVHRILARITDNGNHSGNNDWQNPNRGMLNSKQNNRKNDF